MLDLFVRHLSSAQAISGAATKPAVVGKPSLARISGRDGRVLWDVDVDEQVSSGATTTEPPLGFNDLDGDGGLDVLFLLPFSATDGLLGNSLVAISLRDGRRLWTRALRLEQSRGFVACTGDLDGDGLQEVVFLEGLAKEEGGLIGDVDGDVVICWG